MQEIELTEDLLEELKYIDELQNITKILEAEELTGQVGGYRTLICC